MPAGLVRSGDFRKGSPILLPHQFGNPVSLPEPYGNVMPQSNPTLNSNPVTWTPSPPHFGNQVAFSLQVVPPIVIITEGGSQTTSAVLTNLLGTNSATLTYSGAPAGVTISFAPNPDTGTSVATITVGASVPTGRYTITIEGSASGANVEFTNIQLVVVSSGASTSYGFELENGSGVIVLEDGISILLLENQT